MITKCLLSYWQSKLLKIALGRLHIEFQSDNLAEAIDNDSHNRNLPLFMSQNNDNVELDWKISDIDPVLKTEFVQQYNVSILLILSYIII